MLGGKIFYIMNRFDKSIKLNFKNYVIKLLF